MVADIVDQLDGRPPELAVGVSQAPFSLDSSECFTVDASAGTRSEIVVPAFTDSR